MDNSSNRNLQDQIQDVDVGLQNPVFIPDPDYNDTVPREPPPDYEMTVTATSNFPGGIRVAPTTASHISAEADKGKALPLTDIKVLELGGKGKDEDEPSDGRDSWSNPIEFLMSCISVSVGLGNVWRFPFVAYENGGGAFLIPYLIVLVLIGRPMYYLEMCIGQFSRKGQVQIWNLAPLLKGVGYGTAIATSLQLTIYCSVMAQSIFYFIASFGGVLPWTVCDKSWGGELCNENGTLNSEHSQNRSLADWYYTLEAFPQKKNIDDGIGVPEWRLTLCLLACWIIVFLILLKGIKSSGKVAYFTALFPYVVMIILLIRGVTLDGAGDGVMYFFKPRWEKLLEPTVWYNAVIQCFFSLTTTFGPVIMYSSYNPFRHNLYRDTMIISVLDTCTSLLAGCTIFSVLGYLAKSLGQDIEDVTQGGPGLAFVSYPEALANFPVPQLFSVLFFLMLLTLGIGTAISLVTCIVTVIVDQLTWTKRIWVTLFVCISGFLVGLIYVTPGGIFMIDLVDEFGSNFVVFILALVEIVGVAWIYGVKNFEMDIRFMLNRTVGIYWKFCWGISIPVGLFAILVYKMATYQEYTSGGVAYPKIAIVCGWMLTAFCLSTVPLFGLHTILTRKASTLIEKLKESLRPNERWGPSEPKLKRQWKEFKNAEGL